MMLVNNVKVNFVLNTIECLQFIGRQKKTLKMSGPRPGAQRTFRLSSRTPLGFF